MNRKKIIRRVCIGFCCAALVIAAYLTAIYLVLFKPTFMRRGPFTEAEVRSYFKQDKYYDDFLANKKWFLEDINPDVISITSYDGLELKAYVIEQQDAEGTVVLMHGYKSEPLREWLNLVRYYFDNNYNIILPFQRIHGLSEGKYLTFGVKERYDCRDWILEANRRFGEDVPLYIHGISMGCATVVMTLGFDLPSNVKGCIADCGFTTPREIIYTVVHDESHLPFARLIVGTGNMMAKVIAGFGFDDYSTYEALKDNKIPVLFIHGKDDDFVPVWMTVKNYEVCTSKKELLLVDGCPHAVTNVLERDLYVQKLSDFISECNGL